MKIRLFLLFGLFIINQFGFAQNTSITDFNGLMYALNSGEQVRVVIHYAQCTRQDTSDHTPIPDAIAGMNIDTYEYFAPGAIHNKAAFVVFSQTKLIQNPIGKGFVYNYGKVKIYDDSTVEVTAKYIHPRSYKVLMDETFIGMLNDGKNVEGINLFK